MLAVSTLSTALTGIVVAVVMSPISTLLSMMLMGYDSFCSTYGRSAGSNRAAKHPVPANRPCSSDVIMMIGSHQHEADIIKTALRQNVTRKQSRRQRQYSAWTAALFERRVLQAILYVSMLVIIFALACINVLYSDHFSNGHNVNWIISVVAAAIIRE